MYTADQRSGAMHGRSFLLDSVYAGIDEKYMYGRLDFAGAVPGAFDLVVNIESWASDPRPRRCLRLDASLQAGALSAWKIYRPDEEDKPLESTSRPGVGEAKVVLRKNFEFKMPLSWLLANPVSGAGSQGGKATIPIATRLKVRFSLWENQLPMDALPLEGWIELHLVGESDLAAAAY
jgi:hypothetical protein